MACAGVSYEEHFCCNICLDVFTDPVTLPCGHNFCKTCITKHWSCSQNRVCALCRQPVPQNTELRVNTVLSQMSQQLKTEAQKRREEGTEGEWREREQEVPCDVCGERALKSCSICLASFCEVHLSPHYRSAGLRRHQLIEPVKNLEERTCPTHNRPLRFFCQLDQMFLCQFCSESEHSRHMVVSVEQEGEEKIRELSKLQDKLCDLTEERRKKTKQLKQTARDEEDKTAESVRDCVQAVFKVSRSLEEGLSQMIETMQTKQNEVSRQAEFYVSQLEDEIYELETAGAELEERKKHTNDYFELVQSFETLKTEPRTLDLSQVEVRSFQRSVVDAVVRKMNEIVADLGKFWTEIELKRVQQFTVDATLNAKSLYPRLNLSADDQQLTYGEDEVQIANNPNKFTKNIEVLAQRTLYFSNFYFEINVTYMKWNLGVVREKMDQNDGEILRPESGFWVIQERNGTKFCALTKHKSVNLVPCNRPQRVGVFVDYEARSVSFYNSETAEKIYTFEKCEFNGRVLPYYYELWPCA
ncbi:hypothetical protein NL108_012943 [Boleophthalmus pectinirostris]|uniref:E3 ubiquitin-protein ligase TRIM68-like n=1 Tax=Boleophthalmus pectinirostris TaxID=150288 RepID=UPI00242D6668|nr:E3 ubiquitin-protein ligase TRIM68-like [Boleophthalmus pectinirostris]KAJ0057706.1 hypothetical protein NL108_012943 [Boleophthalmus pectinirostris]